MAYRAITVAAYDHIAGAQTDSAEKALDGNVR
jgi:hypothetical protein